MACKSLQRVARSEKERCCTQEDPQQGRSSPAFITPHLQPPAAREQNPSPSGGCSEQISLCSYARSMPLARCRAQLVFIHTYLHLSPCLSPPAGPPFVPSFARCWLAPAWGWFLLLCCQLGMPQGQWSLRTCSLISYLLP